MPDASVDTYYQNPFAQLGGTPPFDVRQDNAPEGMGIGFDPDSNQIYFYGTPNAEGTYEFAFTVDNACGSFSTSTNLNVVNCVPLVIENFTLPDAIIGQPYEGYIYFTSGTPPYGMTWSITKESIN